MKYVYPAVFTPLPGGEGYDVFLPDIPHCRTCGDSLADAMEMMEDAMAMILAHAEDGNHPIPSPSGTVTCDLPQFVSLIKCDTNEWRRVNDNRAVRKNLTIPAWLNHRAEAAHVNFSGVLHDALISHLKIAQ